MGHRFGSILAPRIDEQIYKIFFKFSTGFWHNFGPFLGRFWSHFGVALVSNFVEETYRIFKSLPGAILGVPGTLRAQNVWIYLVKQWFLKMDLFVPQGLRDRFLGPKWYPNGARMRSKTFQKVTEKFEGKMQPKRHPKWSPNGSPGGSLGCPNGSPGPSRETPGDAEDPRGSPATSPGRPGTPPGLFFH